ncbi:hypothetical protein GIB67_014960 [Kingdonia uniflora]|uniref:Uncharacterized protein n=1 Tax=Kingdonia uniflora TaxID=39325 RepID=A0A7J7MTF3_9MAGN|nr:hypothetical protein GIB67_014960 [Kingdonia uniflora]
MVDDDVEVGREVNLEVMSPEYGGDLLENGDEKVDDVEKDGEEKAKSEEEQPQVVEEEDSEQATVVVYYNGKIDVQHTNETMVVIEVAKTNIVFFNQEEVIGEAYQTKKSKEEVEHSKEEEDVVEASQETYHFFTKESKEEVVEGKDNDNGNSQKKLILMELKVDVTLKKMHTLTDKDNNERAFKMVIDVYIKALIQYFDTQHRAREAKEKIMLADIFSCQYIGRAFNVWTIIMSSPSRCRIEKEINLGTNYIYEVGSYSF